VAADQMHRLVYLVLGSFDGLQKRISSSGDKQ
jgi:hypothetical protein